jgi:glycerol-3-phosphate acyltransferase PlsY
MPVDVSLAAATLALSRGRAGAATYIASAVFIAAALFWWRGGKGNVWGPKPTIGLPLYAISSSAIIAYRFLKAPPTPSLTTEHDALIAVEREGPLRPDAGGTRLW